MFSIPRARTGQPQTPSRLAGSPLANGIFACFDGLSSATDPSGGGAASWSFNGNSFNVPANKGLRGGFSWQTTGRTGDMHRVLDGPLAAAAPWTIAFVHAPTGDVSLSAAFGFGLELVAGTNLIETAVFTAGWCRSIIDFNSHYYFFGSGADWDTGIAWDTDGNQHVIVFVHDGTNIYFYRDGVLRASTARPGGLTATPTACC
jgi:hypothetical protein